MGTSLKGQYPAQNRMHMLDCNQPRRSGKPELWVLCVNFPCSFTDSLSFL